MWKAGFIEDAESLLAGKSAFVSTVKAWAENDAVEKYFVDYSPGGRIRFDRLMKEVDRSDRFVTIKYGGAPERKTFGELMSGRLKLWMIVSALWAIAVASFSWVNYPPYSTDAEVRQALGEDYPEAYADLVDSATTVVTEGADVPAGFSVDPTDDHIEGRLGAIRFLLGRDTAPAVSESLVGAVEAIERRNVRSYLMTGLLLWLGPVIAVLALGAGVGWVIQGLREGES